ncbi:MAG: asparagine synthase (glutamine-hydrolyzing) [Candidatus Sericytochromatia bacterium]
MCGISGLFSLQDSEFLNLILPMNNTIIHRGPDDEGFIFFEKESLKPYIFGGKTTPKEIFESNEIYSPKSLLDKNYPENSAIALGHRRLSILDLSPKGHQPICSIDGKTWCVFNGEVYNYIEIRQELEEKGYKFNSNTDTEVILSAYKEWGKDCLHKFNGMWAFIIVDIEKKKVFIARDRYGVKPLYYWFSPKGFFAIASEIKQFTVLDGWEAKLNPQRTYDFLEYGLLEHTNETMFKDVFQLRRSEALEFNISDLKEIIEKKELPIYRWYDLKPKEFNGNINMAAKEFEKLFVDSVKLRLRADVPVGSCLSGGLDSSSIVCVANKLLAEKDATNLQKTFSACSHEKKYDEKEYIDEVVNTRKIDAHYIYPELNILFENLDELTWVQDEPFGSTSIYAQWSVFKLAAENKVKVMLDGQGSDEQLAGYHIFFQPYLTGLLKENKYINLYKEVKARKNNYGFSEIKSIRSIVANFVSDNIVQNIRKKIGVSETTTNWLNIEKLGAKKINPFKLSNINNSNIKELSYSQLLDSNLQMLLHWEDRDSMLHSIESRLPFLDYRLVEFVLGLPDDFKIRNGITKYILREGLRNYLPIKIRKRLSKLGFETPEEVWIKQNEDTFRNLINKSIELSNGILNESVKQEFEDIVSGKTRFSFFIWRIISFGKWIEKFNIKI